LYVVLELSEVVLSDLRRVGIPPDQPLSMQAARESPSSATTPKPHITKEAMNNTLKHVTSAIDVRPVPMSRDDDREELIYQLSL
jgi:hypothetical protein